MLKGNYIISILAIVLLFSLVLISFQILPQVEKHQFLNKIQGSTINIKELVEEFEDYNDATQYSLITSILTGKSKITPAAIAVLSNYKTLRFNQCPSFRLMKITEVACNSFRPGLFNMSFARKLSKELFNRRPGGKYNRYYELLFKINSFQQSGSPVKPADFLCNCQSPDGSFWSQDGNIDGDLMTTAVTLFYLQDVAVLNERINYISNIKNGIVFLLEKHNKGLFSDDIMVQSACLFSLALAAVDNVAIKTNQGGNNIDLIKIIKAGLDSLESRLKPKLNQKASKSSSLETAWLFLAYFSINQINPCSKIITKNNYPAIYQYLCSYFNRIDYDMDFYKSALLLPIYSVFRSSKQNTLVSKMKSLMKNNLASSASPDCEYVFFGTWALILSPWREIFKMWAKDIKDNYKPAYTSGHFYGGSWNPVYGEYSRKYGRLYTTSLIASARNTVK